VNDPINMVEHKLTRTRVPTLGSTAPERVEKCRPPPPPGGGKDYERPFAIPSFHQKCRPGSLPPPMSGPA